MVMEKVTDNDGNLETRVVKTYEGNRVTEEVYDGDDNLIYKKVWATNGTPIEETEYDPETGDIISSTQYDYKTITDNTGKTTNIVTQRITNNDGTGQEIITVTDNDGNLETRVVKTYEGNRVTEEVYDGDDNLIYKKVGATNGTPIEETEYDPETGDIISSTQYDYKTITDNTGKTTNIVTQRITNNDGTGQEIITVTDNDGNLETRVVKTYEGNRVTEEVYDGDDNLIYKKVWATNGTPIEETEYDPETGDIISSTQYDYKTITDNTGKTTNIVTQRITNNDGTGQEIITVTDNDGNLETRVVKTYEGNRVTKEVYDGDDNLIYKKVGATNGTPIEETEYDPETGDVVSTIEYENGLPVRITEPDLKTVTTIEYGAGDTSTWTVEVDGVTAMVMEQSGDEVIREEIYADGEVISVTEYDPDTGEVLGKISVDNAREALDMLKTQALLIKTASYEKQKTTEVLTFANSKLTNQINQEKDKMTAIGLDAPEGPFPSVGFYLPGETPTITESELASFISDMENAIQNNDVNKMNEIFKNEKLGLDISNPSSIPEQSIGRILAYVNDQQGINTLEATNNEQLTYLADAKKIYNNAVVNIAAAKEDLARTLGVGIGQVEVNSIDYTTWPGSSLGGYSGGMFEATEMTPGYQIVLSVAGKDYEYHTDETGRQILLNPEVKEGIIVDKAKKDLIGRIDIPAEITHYQEISNSSGDLFGAAEERLQSAVGYIKEKLNIAEISLLERSGGGDDAEDEKFSFIAKDGSTVVVRIKSEDNTVLDGTQIWILSRDDKGRPTEQKIETYIDDMLVEKKMINHSDFDDIGRPQHITITNYTSENELLDHQEIIMDYGYIKDPEVPVEYDDVVTYYPVAKYQPEYQITEERIQKAAIYMREQLNITDFSLITDYKGYVGEEILFRDADGSIVEVLFGPDEDISLSGKKIITILQDEEGRPLEQKIEKYTEGGDLVEWKVIKNEGFDDIGRPTEITITTYAYEGSIEDEIKSTIEGAIWGDPSLGGYAEGDMFAQVVTSGYKVILKVGGKEYEYHTDAFGSSILLDPKIIKEISIDKAKEQLAELLDVDESEITGEVTDTGEIILTHTDEEGNETDYEFEQNETGEVTITGDTQEQIELNKLIETAQIARAMLTEQADIIAGHIDDYNDQKDDINMDIANQVAEQEAIIAKANKLGPVTIPEKDFGIGLTWSPVTVDVDQVIDEMTTAINNNDTEKIESLFNDEMIGLDINNPGSVPSEIVQTIDVAKQHLEELLEHKDNEVTYTESLQSFYNQELLNISPSIDAAKEAVAMLKEQVVLVREQYDRDELEKPELIARRTELENLNSEMRQTLSELGVEGPRDPAVTGELMLSQESVLQSFIFNMGLAIESRDANGINELFNDETIGLDINNPEEVSVRLSQLLGTMENQDVGMLRDNIREEERYYNEAQIIYDNAIVAIDRAKEELAELLGVNETEIGVTTNEEGETVLVVGEEEYVFTVSEETGGISITQESTGREYAEDGSYSDRTEKVLYNEDGSVSSKEKGTVYYDESGDVMKTWSDTTTYSYNDDGTLKESNREHALSNPAEGTDMVFTERTVGTYDQDGELDSISVASAWVGTSEGEIVAGEETHAGIYNEDGVMTSLQYTHTDYDEDGITVLATETKTETYRDDAQNSSGVNYSYSDGGMKVEEEKSSYFTYNSDGSFDKKETTSFSDENNNRIQTKTEITEYDAEGNFESQKVTTYSTFYDEDNNMTGQVQEIGVIDEEGGDQTLTFSKAFSYISNEDGSTENRVRSQTFESGSGGDYPGRDALYTVKLDSDGNMTERNYEISTYGKNMNHQQTRTAETKYNTDGSYVKTSKVYNESREITEQYVDTYDTNGDLQTKVEGVEEGAEKYIDAKEQIKIEQVQIGVPLKKPDSPKGINPEMLKKMDLEAQSKEQAKDSRFSREAIKTDRKTKEFK